jgi:hypothetical protein
MKVNIIWLLEQNNQHLKCLLRNMKTSKLRYLVLLVTDTEEMKTYKILSLIEI